MKRVELIIRILIAVIIGEIILVLGTTVAQEVLVKGLNWYSYSTNELFIGGLGSFLAAVISGAVAYGIVKRASVIPLVVLSVLVVLETSWLIQTGRSAEPIWFSALGGATLILGFWVGKIMLKKFPIVRT